MGGVAEAAVAEPLVETGDGETLGDVLAVVPLLVGEGVGGGYGGPEGHEAGWGGHGGGGGKGGEGGVGSWSG